MARSIAQGESCRPSSLVSSVVIELDGERGNVD